MYQIDCEKISAHVKCKDCGTANNNVQFWYYPINVKYIEVTTKYYGTRCIFVIILMYV